MNDEQRSVLIQEMERLLAGITPGEWFISDDDELVACSPIEVASSRGPVVTILNADDFPCAFGDDDDDSKVEQFDREAQANAAFIAAAPRLVRQCLDLLKAPSSAAVSPAAWLPPEPGSFGISSASQPNGERAARAKTAGGAPPDPEGREKDVNR